MKRATKSPAPNMVSLSRGLYGRIARKMKCDPSYVSRVARGERHSARIEAVLRQEFRSALKKLLP
jgi:hypothetical protein